MVLLTAVLASASLTYLLELCFICLTGNCICSVLIPGVEPSDTWQKNVIRLQPIHKVKHLGLYLEKFLYSGMG